MKGYIGRYAPSPTGDMHLGNLRTAMLAWLDSRSQHGRFILRFEDLDHTRVRATAYESIRQDLQWLGLDWDAEYKQSERLELYRAALNRLPHYPCSCSRKDIIEAAGAPHGAELIYPQSCLHGALKPNAPVAQRWHIPSGTVCAQDRVLGQRLAQLQPDIGDMVLQRADGVYAYHLAVVVDDADMQVNHVVRGLDLWPSTPHQLALQQALGYPTPHYWHVPLMTDYRGQRLAKRQGAPSVRALREGGYSATRLLAELASSLGWSVAEHCSLEQFLQDYPQHS